MAVWDKTAIAGQFVFTAKPDSAIRQDAAADRKEALDRYQLMANDPNVNRQELLRDLLLKSNLDPSTILVQPQPAKPAPPTVAISFSGEDLNPLSLSYPGVYAVLTSSGVQGLPQPPPHPVPMGVGGGMGPPAEHPGSVARVSPLNQHAQDASGQLAGGGLAANVGHV